MTFSPKEMTPSTLKGMVHRLERELKNTPNPTQWPPKQSLCQEWMAKSLNFKNWHEAISITGENNHSSSQLDLSLDIKKTKINWKPLSERVFNQDASLSKSNT